MKRKTLGEKDPGGFGVLGSRMGLENPVQWGKRRWEEMAETKLERCVLPRLDEIRAWAQKGAAEKDIAKALGVGVSTFRHYKTQCAALQAALDSGSEKPIEMVESALYRRAVGYDYEERKEIRKLMDGEMVLVEEQIYKKHLPPDPKAIAVWLSNRAGDRWKFGQKPDAADNCGGEWGVVVLPAATDGEEAPADAEPSDG